MGGALRFDQVQLRTVPDRAARLLAAAGAQFGEGKSRGQ